MRRAAVVLVLLVGGAAHAEKPPDDPVEVGRRAYRLGDWDTAIQEWTLAYKLTGAPELLYDLGQAWSKKGDRERAVFFFQSYLHAAPDSPRRAEVETQIAELQPASQPAPRRPAPRHPFLAEAAIGVGFPGGDYDTHLVDPSPTLSLELAWFPIRPLGVLLRGRYVPELTKAGYTAHHLGAELGARGELAVGAGFALHAEVALVFASEEIASSTVNGSASGWGVDARAGATRAFGRIALGLDVGYQAATISSAAFAGDTKASWLTLELTGGVRF